MPSVGDQRGRVSGLGVQGFGGLEVLGSTGFKVYGFEVDVASFKGVILQTFRLPDSLAESQKFSRISATVGCCNKYCEPETEREREKNKNRG